MASERPANIHYKLGRLHDKVQSPPVSDLHGRIYVLDRVWDVENKRKQKTVIVVKSKERGARTKVNACAYSPDGSLIGGGTWCAFRSPSKHPLIACT